MSLKEILYEYDLIYLGKKYEFSKSFFSNNTRHNEALAIGVLKHAIEYYLKWTPEVTVKFLNEEIIDLMKLKQVMNYIKFPKELDPKKDYFYVAHLMYPDIIPYNVKDIVIKGYKRILKGEKCKFMKNYMSGIGGYINAEICFQYMLEQYLQFSSIEEMYNYFSSPEGIKTLRQYRLLGICTDMYESPLEFLHQSLTNEQKDDFWYHYYRFNESNNNQIKKMKKNGTFKI